MWFFSLYRSVFKPSPFVEAAAFTVMSDFFALQIGINYKSKRQSVLSGCVNDITNTAVFWHRLGISFRTHIVCSDESSTIPCTVRKGALKRDIIAGMYEHVLPPQHFCNV